MNSRKGYMIILVASMVSISAIASEEVSATEQPIATSADEQGVVTKDAKDVIAQAVTETTASPSTLAQIRELMGEWSTWVWKEGIQEHPYLSAGCGLTAVLLVYLLTSKIYRDAVIQENNDDWKTKPKSCCRKKRQEEAAAAETTSAVEVLAPTSESVEETAPEIAQESAKRADQTTDEVTNQPAPAVTAIDVVDETVAVTTNDTAEATVAEETTGRILTSKDLCETHGCACLVDGRCLCEKDERGSCSCCHKKMQELRESKESRARWQEEATAIFLKKILVAMKEYKAAMNWAQ